MRKGIVISVVVLFIVSLSYNVYLIMSDRNSEDQRKACTDVDIERSMLNLLDYNRPVENLNPVTDFNYDMQEDDEINIHFYEYIREGMHYRPLSNHQLEQVSQGLRGDIEHFLTKIEGKNSHFGYLYGPVHNVIIELISSEYEMEIRLGNGFVTIILTEDGSERVFSINDGLDHEIEQLIAKVKHEGE